MLFRFLCFQCNLHKCKRPDLELCKAFIKKNTTNLSTISVLMQLYEAEGIAQFNSSHDS